MKEKPWWKQVPARAEEKAAPSDLADGESWQVRGSSGDSYVLRNTGGVYSCTCPAWRIQSLGIEKRTCKHLRGLRGDEAERARVGEQLVPAEPATTPGTVRASDAAPPLLLAHSWKQDVELDGWWMSEKLDGVRAYWDGKRLISRLGNEFYAPDWFLAGLPETPLDGELWGGRKRFQRAVSIVRRQDRSELWREIQYVIFDAPAHGGAFEERLRSVEAFVTRAKAGGVAHVAAHLHVQCRGVEHLRDELARVEALGGEGLMLRMPGSRYEIGRSSTLLKVKTFHDAEARVVAHLPGTGKHAGRLGALQCEMPGGTRFSVGTGFSDQERESPPPVGSLVTYRYQELSNDGVPRFPSYVRVREDA